MKCGLGNWTDISEQYLKAQKRPDECETHYFSVLMQQSDKITYQNALISRASPSDPASEHKLDKKIVSQIESQIDSYVAMKAKEKEQETREFQDGVNQSTVVAPLPNYMERSGGRKAGMGREHGGILENNNPEGGESGGFDR